MHTFFNHFYFVYFLLLILTQVLGLMANHLIIHMDYAENFHHLSQLQSQAEYFNMLQSSLFILMAYFINPNTGLLEVATFGFFTADLNKSSVSSIYYFCSDNLATLFIVTLSLRLLSKGACSILHRKSVQYGAVFLHSSRERKPNPFINLDWQLLSTVQVPVAIWVVSSICKES